MAYAYELEIGLIQLTADLLFGQFLAFFWGARHVRTGSDFATDFQRVYKATI